MGVFIFCKVKDNEELQQLCSPPIETWPVPLPIAWGCVKEVLESASVVTGTGGSSGWRMQQEDDSRGLISARLDFSQQLGGVMNAEKYERTIVCNVQLTPAGSSTQVQVTYQVTSPMGDGSARSVIEQTQRAFRRTMEANAT